ncbi:MAG: hypothetical protein IJ349_08595 [Clostridia bacterium]|nr:hypothetical protein [Clostridia bacterium]
MKKTAKKLLSILLSALMLLPFSAVAFAADGDYTINSPYADVIWEGENAWGAYKGNLHSHTTYSDADVDLATMVKEYYNQGYDFLANADHGITGKEWNRHQTFLPLYAYQTLLGNKVQHLTDEEFEGITSGTYPTADGTVRGNGMTCVVGANELNNLTLTKSHVNGYFLPEGVGDGFGGRENGFELAVAFVDKAGGLSHINHPGDFLESSRNIDAVSDKENVALFGDILLKYDSCLGIEVFNENNSVTPYDRILWDNLLMYCLPYGKNVIGFSNTDAHRTEDIDTSFSVFMMEENTSEKVKETMQSGAFFAVTRRLKANDVIGPAKEIDARNTDIPYPIFTKVEVEGHEISVKAENADTIQWIADGKVIASGSISDGYDCLDLDTVDGAEDFTYVRAELFGKGGICLTQALVIEDGSATPTYEGAKGFDAIIKNIVYFFKSSLLWTIIVEITRL